MCVLCVYVFGLAIYEIPSNERFEAPRIILYLVCVFVYLFILKAIHMKKSKTVYSL